MDCGEKRRERESRIVALAPFPAMIVREHQGDYTPKLEPQPQVFMALGLLNTKPRPFRPSV